MILGYSEQPKKKKGTKLSQAFFLFFFLNACGTKLESRSAVKLISMALALIKCSPARAGSKKCVL